MNIVNKNITSKKIIFLLIFTFLTNGLHAQSLVGAWETQTIAKDVEKIKNVLIFSKGYQVITSSNAETGKFISTNGGMWKLEGDTVTEKVEFDTKKPERVGTEVSFKVYIKDSIMGIVDDKLIWHRIDKGTPGELKGAWLMSGRMRNGEIQSRDTNRPRKTMKILSGTRFQWIAYNTETKEFMGTGGGTYTTIDGKYTENIEFFSRDNSRVGASLEFNFSLDDGKWNHSGLSSKGDPIHEIWSERE